MLLKTEKPEIDEGIEGQNVEDDFDLLLRGQDALDGGCDAGFHAVVDVFNGSLLGCGVTGRKFEEIGLNGALQRRAEGFIAGVNYLEGDWYFCHSAVTRMSVVVERSVS